MGVGGFPAIRVVLRGFGRDRPTVFVPFQGSGLQTCIFEGFTFLWSNFFQTQHAGICCLGFSALRSQGPGGCRNS